MQDIQKHNFFYNIGGLIQTHKHVQDVLSTARFVIGVMITIKSRLKACG